MSSHDIFNVWKLINVYNQQKESTLLSIHAKMEETLLNSGLTNENRTCYKQ